MNKRTAILHANCQGRPLAARLLASTEFARNFSPRVYLNYTREEIPEAEISACGLFLYQFLGPEWGGLSSAALLSRLPADCVSLCIPNMFFRGPWPLWSGAPGFDYRDVLLDQLLDMGLPRRDILHVYLSTPLARKFDLDALLAETVARETERQSHTPVRYLDFVLEHWRKRPLFLSVNHPGPELLQLAAAGILRQLGLAPPAPELLPEAGALGEGYADFELPVHPQAAAFYGLTYGGDGSAFNVYGKARIAAQYAAAYVDCRLAGENDFISYLHLV
ncbi:MAG: hypothetical protein CVU73_10235 [Deltaproteobacteria bacterium HGW-Deltaproteobacteria-8]|nr:MAG: hypothetical protein CVU73_10235 [Deltaproteobacteria bacterium HGW-Deltaproteobacteria-8]